MIHVMVGWILPANHLFYKNFQGVINEAPTIIGSFCSLDR